MGAWGVPISWATHRTAGGVTGVCEPAEVLCVDRLVALQDPDGFVNFEPLSFPPCGNVQEKHKVKLWVRGLH